MPAGVDWQHEVKFDGFRVQAHIIGKTVELYSRNGSKFSRRFPRLASVLGELPTRSAIIDGEIVASDAAGIARLLAPASLIIFGALPAPSTKEPRRL